MRRSTAPKTLYALDRLRRFEIGEVGLDREPGPKTTIVVEVSTRYEISGFKFGLKRNGEAISGK